MERTSNLSLQSLGEGNRSILDRTYLCAKGLSQERICHVKGTKAVWLK